MRMQFRSIGRSLTLSASALLVASITTGQMTAGARPPVRPDKNAPKAHFVPMHDLLRTAGFKVVQLPKDSYSYMSSEVAELPKGFQGRLKTPQNIVLLSYGAKTGGIVRIYQTPAIPGLDPTKFMKKVADLGIFRDINRRPNWTFTAKTTGGLFVIPTSSDPKYVQDALKALNLAK